MRIAVVLLLVAIATIQICLAYDRYTGIRRLRRSAHHSGEGPIWARSEQKESTTLFIGVPSGTSERRAAIRDSWAKHAEASKDMILRFYVHEECSDDEEMHHHDVVCTRDLDFQDPLDRDQEGVTQRVYLMMQHAQANFDMKYFMKADDDTYVNVPIILHMLQTRTDDHFVYIGKRMTRHELMSVETELAQYFTKDLGLSDFEMTYMQGGAYILSKEAVDGIVALNHATGLRFLHFEDVSVGIWVSGMQLRYITDADANLHFANEINLWAPERLPEIKVTENYCKDAEKPIAWVHPLKQADALLEVARTAEKCQDIHTTPDEQERM